MEITQYGINDLLKEKDPKVRAVNGVAVARGHQDRIQAGTSINVTVDNSASKQALEIARLAVIEAQKKNQG